MAGDSPNGQAGKSAEKRTGIFYEQDPPGIVVILDGEVRYRYRTKREFVEAHVKAMAALEREMADLLESHYRPDGSPRPHS